MRTAQMKLPPASTTLKNAFFVAYAFALAKPKFPITQNLTKAYSTPPIAA